MAKPENKKSMAEIREDIRQDASYMPVARTPDWKEAPEWARYVAQERYGDWYWHENRPVAMTYGGWYSPGSARRVFARSIIQTKVEGDWTMTMRTKP